MDSLRFQTKRGNEIRAVFEELAQLRIEVFRDYPYLYEGSIEYEKDYLETYAQSVHSFLFAVFHNGKMVGATTCIPLKDEATEIRLPFEQQAYDVSSIFYFGESILLKQFRGLGLGHRFFDEREAHARSFQTYQKTCFLSVERPADHPDKPLDYRSNELFWKKRGYLKIPALKTTLSWPDLGKTASTPKPLVCWMKEL